MKKYITLFIIIFFCKLLIAQESQPTPILVDKEALSGLNLHKIDLKDEPEKDFYQKMLFNGEL